MISASVVADYATNLSIDHPELAQKVADLPLYYKGRGNLCQRLAIHFTGNSRDERLALINRVLGTHITSMKDLTAAQLRALFAFREYLDGL